MRELRKHAEAEAGDDGEARLRIVRSGERGRRTSAA
jgi:hypothetical protein